MARVKGGKKKAERAIGGIAASNIARAMGETAGRGLRPMLPLLALGLGYAGLTYLLWLPVRTDPLAGLDKTQISSLPALRVSTARPWLGEEDLDGIRQLGHGAVGHSVFEPDLASELAQAYASSPWIKRPGLVQLSYPAAVHLTDLEFRRPFAYIKGGRRPQFLDREGTLLPLTKHMKTSDFPWISGVARSASRNGEGCNDSKIMEGLRVLETVAEVLARSRGNLKALGARLDGVEWTLELDNHSENQKPTIVDWGIWDENNRPIGELNTREKKEALSRCLSEVGTTPIGIRLNQPETPFYNLPL